MCHGDPSMHGQLTAPAVAIARGSCSAGCGSDSVRMRNMTPERREDSRVGGETARAAKGSVYTGLGSQARQLSQCYSNLIHLSVSSRHGR